MSEDSHPTVRRGSQASPEPGFQPAIDLTRLDATSSGQAKQPAGSTVDIQQARLDNDDFIGEIPGKILGDFELLREIGRGGMGVVYEAKQLSLGKRVALKILPASAMLDARAVKRFQNEAWATAQLQHRHIVPVNQIGSERGIHFFSMQLIEGMNLAQFCQNLRRLSEIRSAASEPAEDFHPFQPLRRKGSSGHAASKRSSTANKNSTHASDDSARDTLASRELIRSLRKTQASSSPKFLTALANLGIQVADALHYAHEMGIIHRDVKPSNLLIDPDGEVWVSDFGLAHIETNASLTATGGMVGTLRYMSPEQVLGKRVGIDHRTDVYSLGVTLYELLTLQPAFSGRDREELIRRITFDEPIPPRKIDRAIPIEIETIILKAMSKNALDRYQTAAELADDLRRYRNNEPIRGRKPPLRRRALRWSQRHRSLVASLASLVFVMFFAAILIAGISLQLYAVTTEALESERKQRSIVQQSLRRSEGLRMAANSAIALDTEPTQAVLLALEGAKQFPGSATNQAILNAVNHLHEKMTLLGHSTSVGHVAFNGDGNLLISCPHSTAFGEQAFPAIIWDVNTGRQVRELTDQTTITSAEFSPDQFRILTASSPLRHWSDAKAAQKNLGSEPSVWDASSGQKLLSFEGATLSRAHLGAFDAEGRRVVLPYQDRSAAIFDCVAGHRLVRLEGHDARVVFATFAPESNRIVTVSDDNTVRIWDATTGDSIHRLDLWHQRQPLSTERLIDSVAFTSDGRRLITGSRDLGIHLWEMETGRRINDQHVKGNQIQAWPSSPQLLTYHRYDHELGVRQADNGQLLRTLKVPQGLLSGVRISPDGQLLAVRGHQRTSRITVWDAVGGELATELYGHESSVTALAFSPDSQLIASASSDRTVRLWYVQDGKQRATFPTQVWFNEPNAVASPDGQQLAIVSSEFEPCLATVDFDPLSVATQPLLRAWLDHAVSTRYAATHRNRLSVYSVADGSEIKTFHSVNGDFVRAAMTPAGNRLAATTRLGIGIGWDLEEDREFILDDDLRSVSALQFNPAGDRLAVAGADGNVRVYDFENGRRLANLPCDAGIVSLQFSRDGERLIVATDQSRAELWDLQDFSNITTFQHDDAIFNHAVYSYDEQHLLTYQSFGSVSVQLWDLDSGELQNRLDVSGLVQLVVHPTRHEALVASSESGGLLWKYNDSQRRVVTDLPMQQAQFSADGKRFFLSRFTTMPRQPWQSISQPSEMPKSSLRCWRTEDLEPLEIVNFDSSRISNFQVTAEGRVLLNTTRPASVVNYDLDTHRPRSRIAGHLAPITELLFSTDSKQLITASWGGRLAVWDAASGRELHQLQGHETAVTSLAVSQDNRFLLSGDRSGRCILWDLATGNSQFDFSLGDAAIQQIALHPSGNQMIAITATRELHSYDLVLRQQTEIGLEDLDVSWVEYSPDGNSFLVVPSPPPVPPNSQLADRAGDEQTSETKTSAGQASDHVKKLNGFDIRIVSTGSRSITKLTYTSPINSAHFHPDGTKLLAATRDGGVNLRDIDDGEVLQAFTSPGSKVNAAAIDSTGDYVAVIGARYISIWKVSGTKWLSVPAALSLPKPSHRFAPFVPGRRQLFTRSPETNQLRTWPLQPVAFAESVIPRKLTEREISTYGVGTQRVVQQPLR